MQSTRQDHLRGLWDASAPAYDAHTRRFPTHAQITTLLTAVLATRPHRILDFGCGPGNSTRLLRQQLPQAFLLGLDTSAGMIRTAKAGTTQSEYIDYRCGDVDALIATDPDPYDLVVCSNSLFHVENKPSLLAQFRQLLMPAGKIVFSLYDTVLQPTQAPAWPLAQDHADTLMTQILDGLRLAGHPVTARKEDRQILTEADLTDLFAGQGFSVRCAGQLRLYRSVAERLSFFQIPAVTQEVFPDVDRADAAQVIASLPVAELPAQERTVYAFIADKQ